MDICTNIEKSYIQWFYDNLIIFILSNKTIKSDNSWTIVNRFLQIVKKKGFNKRNFDYYKKAKLFLHNR